MIKKLLICLLLFSVASIAAFACTLGVANGSASSDGRPMLWKIRDFEIRPNIVFYTETDRYNFVSNITPEYGYDKSWFGLNNQGFAIANTYIIDFPEGEKGKENGEFMNQALKHCILVSDFKNLLDSTNISGRKTRGIFGVIDSEGGAAIFEVNSNEYWMFDANDSKVAPQGYIVRSNFTMSNGGDRGIERYERSSQLIKDYYNQNDLNVKSILQGQMRDMIGPDGETITAHSQILQDSHFNSLRNICRGFSISATVIQGVKDNEPAYLTTMWTMLGNPFTSVAVPYWPVGPSPEISASDSDQSLYGIAQQLKEYIYDSPGEPNHVNIEKAFELREPLFAIEDSIYIAATQLLDQWRTNAPSKVDILEIEKRFADETYLRMLDIHNQISH